MNNVSFNPSFGMAYKINPKGIAKYLSERPSQAPGIVRDMQKAQEELKDTKHVDLYSYVDENGKLRHKTVEKYYYLGDDFNIQSRTAESVSTSIDDQKYFPSFITAAKSYEEKTEAAYQELTKQSEILRNLDIVEGTN